MLLLWGCLSIAQNTIPDSQTSTNTAAEGDIYIGVPSGNIYLGLSNGVYHSLNFNIATTNLYTTDGTIPNNRVVTGNPSSYLWFNNFKEFYINASSVIRLASDSNIQLEASNYIRLVADIGIRLQGNTTALKDFILKERLVDGTFSSGSPGDILSSTGAATKWIPKNALISTDDTNSITTGTDQGLYYENPIKAYGKITASGPAAKIIGALSSRISRGQYQIIFTTPFSHNNYTIQLAQKSRNGQGNDDPGIAYYDQTNTGFKVRIGDNDNGGSDRNKFDSEFMFTVMD